MATAWRNNGVLRSAQQGGRDLHRMNNRLAICGVFAVNLMAGCSVLRPEPPLGSPTGANLYQQFCASCHGIDGQGNGPVAPVLKGHVTDLTRIAARDGGEFPTEDVRWVIDGRSDRRAHGTREMPVWGRQLYDSRKSGDAAARARADASIDTLVRYLASIQRP
jgi:mono/diheme cytochrome c family protein